MHGRRKACSETIMLNLLTQKTSGYVALRLEAGAVWQFLSQYLDNSSEPSIIKREDTRLRLKHLNLVGLRSNLEVVCQGEIYYFIRTNRPSPLGN